MLHPLDGCYRRIKRASRYIREADQLLRTMAHECEQSVIVNPDHTLFFKDPPEVPPDLPLAISDGVHNLRAALDYLVYQLAKLDSGSFQDGTQFPIENVKSSTSPSGNKFGFDAVVNRYLKGVNQTHRDDIEALQPYNGVNWTKTLRDISNPDKHRLLTPFSNERIKYFFTISPAGSPDRSGKVLPSGDTLHAHHAHAVNIVLPDGERNVVGTLYSLQAGVMDTINAFNPAF